jgi:23S rRNA (adenine2030-N6)-methyltransferase
MKYRHQYHAGNFADVHKHVLLLDVLAALARKDKGFLFVDTHAGRGEYDLHPGDTQHPAEWQSGVAKLLAATPRHESLQKYRDIIAAGVHGGSLVYPGSPLLAARALRPADRAVFFETQREESGHLRKVLPPGGRIRVEGSDFSRAQAALLDALGRFEGAVLVLWMPVKLRTDFDAWLAQLTSGASRPALASLLWMHPMDSRAALNGSALVVVNPPYLLEEAVRGWLPELQAILGNERSGCAVISPSGPR